MTRRSDVSPAGAESGLSRRPREPWHLPRVRCACSSRGCACDGLRAGRDADYGGSFRSREPADVSFPARTRGPAAGCHEHRERHTGAARRNAATRPRSSGPCALSRCVAFYQAGIEAVIALAAIYAREAMGFTTTETFTLILLVNITAAAGVFLFGQFQDRLGHVCTIALTLIGWTVVVVLAWEPRAGSAPAEREPRWPGSRLRPVRRTRDGRLPESAFPTREFFSLWGLAVSSRPSWVRSLTGS